MIALVSGGVLYHVHTDHLGTPQAATDATVWSRAYLPFGEEAAAPAPLPLALRFPGQWADGESGYQYNVFRDYDPSLGRYIQSDPIGLRGGWNTYAYVGGNPLRRVDPFGLFDNESVDSAAQTPAERFQEELFLSPWKTLLGVLNPVRSIGIVARSAITSCDSSDAKDNPFGIPDNYIAQPSNKGGGTRYVDPGNPHNSVRVMPGNPSSPNPAQQLPYVKDMRNGQSIDVSGARVSPSSPESHIPQSLYKYKP